MTLMRASRFSAVLFLALLAAPSLAADTETAPAAKAAALLGADVKGESWTVAPDVQSDGFLYLFSVDSTYGKFQVNGLRRMQERAQELRALEALEKMSSAGVFVDAVAQAGLAPIRFGRDLILDPIETTGNLVSGVGDMFDSVVKGVSGEGEGRDTLFESAIGITKAERDLARELHVDPYTDFTPLREGLAEIARVMAAGNISVSAAISAIPGGAGIAVSATSTASDLSTTIYDKTSDEIAELVANELKALGVDEATIKAFVGNHLYSPADQFAISEALGHLNAQNSAVFVLSAASAASVDVAKFNRYRAELLAKESERLGVLKEFVTVADVAINRDAQGRLVAAFPFDQVAWTETVESSLTNLSAGIAALGESDPVVFATTGEISATAQKELKSRGWTIMKLD